MNAARRKELARAKALIEEARSIIEAVAADERDAFDNMPEGLQETDRGQRMSEIADNLDELASTLEEAETTLDEARE